MYRQIINLAIKVICLYMLILGLALGVGSYLFGLSGCAHQAPSNTVNAAASEAPVFKEENSVFPVRYYMGDLRGKSYHCSGFYASPELFVTSATLIPNDTAIETHRLALLNDDLFGGIWDREVEEIAYFSRDDGLLILKTKERGENIPLAMDISGEDLAIVGFDFASYLKGIHVARWWRKSARFTQESLKGDVLTGGQMPYQFIDRGVDEGLCGAAVLNKRDRAAGLIHKERGHTSIVIPAWRVRATLKKIRNGS